MLAQTIFLFTLVVLSAAQEVDSLQQDSIVVKEELSARIVHDSWFSQDKFVHFSVCTAITGLTYHFYVCRLDKDERTGKIYSVSITAIAGIGKEIYDKKRKGHFSWKDLFWDGIGLVVGYFVFVY